MLAVGDGSYLQTSFKKACVVEVVIGLNLPSIKFICCSDNPIDYHLVLC